jgi:uncharacterized protein YqhQ
MTDRTAYGGQAVIEGVMIRGKERVATACRAKDGSILVQREPVEPTARHPFWRLAFFRGTPALIDSFRLGYRTLIWSADVAAEGEQIEKPSPAAYTLSIITALVIGIGLFVVLPAWITAGVPAGIFKHLPDGLVSTLHLHMRVPAPQVFHPTWDSLLFSLNEGLLRIVLLIAYILFISRMAEVRRLFAYHGAEHKVVNGYEAGAALTVDAVRPYTRIHPRCGTSFIFLFFIVGILLHALVGLPQTWMIVLSRLVMIPIIAGIAYELIRLAGRYRHAWLLQALVWPGMLLQRLTTAEPQDDQIEVALAALRAVLEDEGVLTPDTPPTPALPEDGAALA